MESEIDKQGLADAEWVMEDPHHRFVFQVMNYSKDTGQGVLASTERMMFASVEEKCDWVAKRMEEADSTNEDLMTMAGAGGDDSTGPVAMVKLI